MEATDDKVWRKCSSCKKPIALGAKYYICSVSTCNGLRTGYVFCSIPCFETHLPGARHKQAGAIEKIAPRTADAPAGEAGGLNAGPSSSSGPSPSSGQANTGAEPRAPARIMIKPAVSTSSTGSSSSVGFGGAKSAAPQEVLVIASRLKDYIQARADFNTSATVMDVLSDYLRILCDRGIDNARAEGRKTVLDRDFDFLKKA